MHHRVRDRLFLEHRALALSRLALRSRHRARLHQLRPEPRLASRRVVMAEPVPVEGLLPETIVVVAARKANVGLSIRKQSRRAFRER